MASLAELYHELVGAEWRTQQRYSGRVFINSYLCLWTSLHPQTGPALRGLRCPKLVRAMARRPYGCRRSPNDERKERENDRDSAVCEHRTEIEEACVKRAKGKGTAKARLVAHGWLFQCTCLSHPRYPGQIPTVPVAIRVCTSRRGHIHFASAGIRTVAK